MGLVPGDKLPRTGKDLKLWKDMSRGRRGEEPAAKKSRPLLRSRHVKKKLSGASQKFYEEKDHSQKSVAI